MDNQVSYHNPTHLHFITTLNVMYNRCCPLRHLWCMRYEAKHRYFKQTAKVLGIFKNISKTLAQRHQRYMCYILSTPSTFLSDKHVSGPVVSKHITCFEHQYEIIATCPTINQDSTVQRSVLHQYHAKLTYSCDTSIEQNGWKFKPPSTRLGTVYCSSLKVTFRCLLL